VKFAVTKIPRTFNQSINLLKAKGPIGHLHRSKIHDIKYINTHKHIAYVATLPCETLMSAKQACFADTNISQGCVATYARCGGIFNIYFTTNLQRKLLEKKYVKWLIFDRIMVMGLWPHFFGQPGRPNIQCTPPDATKHLIACEVGIHRVK